MVLWRNLTMNQNYVPFESPKPLPKYTGRLKKIQLISNNMGYWPEPEQGEELEQHLTVTDKGRVWLSRYCYDRENNKLLLNEKESFKISAEAVNAIMDAVTDCFSGDYQPRFATDIGFWDLTLTNDENEKICLTGSLTSRPLDPEEYLSDIIRKNLGRDDLFVFDGNPDKITRVEVKYHRLTKIKPENATEEIGDNYITLDYHESLVLDRETETMEHISELGSGCKITKTYHVEGGIISLLDSLDLYFFADFPDKIPDTVEDPLDSRNYEISISSKLGESRVVTGAFDSNGLPLNWAQFIEYIYDFMEFYEPGELFDPEIYKKPKRRKSDLIFCNVEFEDYGRTYCYLADSDDYSVGDKVVVPAGPDNVESVATIKSIEYRQSEDAPYPVEKTKHILRKYTEDNKT